MITFILQIKYYSRTSIIRGFLGQSLIRLSTADNRGLTVYIQISKKIQLLRADYNCFNVL